MQPSLDQVCLFAANPLRYRGYYYDVETGWYYLNSRYYDPATGRFINADGYASTGQGLLGANMFAYCLNNPVNRVDPSGCFSWNLAFIPDGFVSLPDEEHIRNLNTEEGHAGSVRPIRDVTEEIDRALTIWSAEARDLVNLANWLPSILRLSAQAGIYSRFYNMVNHRAPWDIKYADSWSATIGTEFPGQGVQVMYRGKLMTPEEIGNFTYGYLGAAYDIPSQTLLFGSYYAAGFPTGSDLQHEFDDWTYIIIGYDAYRRDYG